MSRRTGIAAATAGLVAAGVAAGVAAERRAVGRARGAPDPYADEPFGALHSAGTTVVARDGVPLHVEADGQGDMTVVFVHGFTLSMDCWHFQRRDLTGIGRRVFYDQRSHGASGRSPRKHATIDQLGDDLYLVLRAVAPTGPVVLIGHSMGGMTLLALADQHPELFRPGGRVAAVALMDTAAGAFAETAFGLPGFVGRAVRPVAPGLFRAANRRAHLIERGRRAGGDVAFLLTRRFSYGHDVPPSLVAFMERMVAHTPVEVMTEFFETFLTHDKLHALDVLRDLPTLILCGERDLITPAHNSRHMAQELPDAEYIEVAGAGHMTMLERPALVNDALRRLVLRAQTAAREKTAS